jgi:hypothetical protein
MYCEVKCHAAILSHRVCFIRWEMLFRFIASCTLHGTDSQGWCGQWYSPYATGHDLAFRKQILRAWMNALEIKGKWGGEHAKNQAGRPALGKGALISYHETITACISLCFPFEFEPISSSPCHFHAELKLGQWSENLCGNQRDCAGSVSLQKTHMIMCCQVWLEVRLQQGILSRAHAFPPQFSMTLTLIPLLLVSLFPLKLIQWSSLKDCAVSSNNNNKKKKDKTSLP